MERQIQPEVADIKAVRKPDLNAIPLPPEGIDTQNLYGAEIGCGAGLHPVLWCKKHPGRKYLAIEHTRIKFEKFRRRAEHHQLPGLIPCHANAISVFAHAIAPESLQQVNLLYPNPNPKRLNQRWHAMPIMWTILDALKPGGRLTLATNELFYYREAKAYFLNFWRLNLLQDEELTAASVTEFRTHFEKKYLLSGQICYNLVFQKPEP